MTDDMLIARLHELRKRWVEGQMTEDDFALRCSYAADSWARNAAMAVTLAEHTL